MLCSFSLKGHAFLLCFFSHLSLGVSHMLNPHACVNAKVEQHMVAWPLHRGEQGPLSGRGMRTEALGWLWGMEWVAEACCVALCDGGMWAETAVCLRGIGCDCWSGGEVVVHIYKHTNPEILTPTLGGGCDNNYPHKSDKKVRLREEGTHASCCSGAGTRTMLCWPRSKVFSTCSQIQ